MGPDLLEMRRQVDSGALGDVRLIRATCDGDLLSDGAHLVDLLRWLASGRPVRWEPGQVYREQPVQQDDLPLPLMFG